MLFERTREICTNQDLEVLKCYSPNEKQRRQELNLETCRHDQNYDHGRH